jgi:hypothetical protein
VPQDKTKPGDFSKADNLTIIPSEAEISDMPLAKLQRFFSPENFSKMVGGSS